MVTARELEALEKGAAEARGGGLQVGERRSVDADSPSAPAPRPYPRWRRERRSPRVLESAVRRMTPAWSSSGRILVKLQRKAARGSSGPAQSNSHSVSRRCDRPVAHRLGQQRPGLLRRWQRDDGAGAHHLELTSRHTSSMAAVPPAGAERAFALTGSVRVTCNPHGRRRFFTYHTFPRWDQRAIQRRFPILLSSDGIPPAHEKQEESHAHIRHFRHLRPRSRPRIHGDPGAPSAPSPRPPPPPSRRRSRTCSASRST